MGPGEAYLFTSCALLLCMQNAKLLARTCPALHKLLLRLFEMGYAGCTTRAFLLGRPPDVSRGIRRDTGG